MDRSRYIIASMNLNENGFGVYTLPMVVETSLIFLFFLDASLIYLIYSYNRQGTINRFLGLLLIPITLTNLEMLLLYSAASRIPFNIGLNIAVFGANFFFPLIFHFSFYFPRKRTTKKWFPFFAYLYLPPIIFGIGMILGVNSQTSLITFRDLIFPAHFFTINPVYYVFYMLNFVFICIVLAFTTKRMVNSLKLPILAREKKTVVMVIAGFIPLSFILLFNYLIFIPFEGGIYFYLAASATHTVYFLILVFRFGFIDRKSIYRVFFLLPGFFILLVLLYSKVLASFHETLSDIFELKTPVIISLEILIFITIVPPSLRMLSRYFGRNRVSESEYFFQVLKEGAGRMIHIIELSELDRFLTELFIFQLKLKTFYFLILDEASDSFKPCKVHLGEEFPSFRKQGELARRIRIEKQGANTQQLALSWGESRELEILDRFKIVLIVPLLEGSRLAGIFMFGEPGVARTWRQEEIEEIEMFASGIPVVIARCRTHNRAIAMEKKQARIERMAVLHEITSGIAHEVRNPLSIISNSAETIASRNLPPEEIKKLAGYIEEETNRMARLLSRILSYVPRAEYNHGITDVVPVLEKTFDLVGAKASKQGTKLEIRCAGESCTAVIDREALTQVCLNLALNGLEAATSGGYVKVSVESAETEVTVSFANTGKPIPKEIRGKIFDPFFTTKKNGTGLGLSISSRLVKEAGGRIVLREDGADTTFELHLPVPGASQADTLQG